MALVFSAGSRAGAQSDYEKFSNAVHGVRLALEADIGKIAPSLSVLVQTSNDYFFASSAGAPWLPITPDTYLRFASNTKNFTAAAVLNMHSRGLLDVYARITDMIPGSDIPYVPDGTNWNIPNKEIITIEQLLRHSAGVYDVDNSPVPGSGHDSYVDYMLGLYPDHQFTADELVGQVALHGLSYFMPGQSYHYSDTGYTILSEIIARVYSRACGAAKTYSDYLYEQILGATAPVPLPGMRFPHLASDTALPEPYVPAVQYLADGGTVVVTVHDVLVTQGPARRVRIPEGFGTNQSQHHKA